MGDVIDIKDKETKDAEVKAAGTPANVAVGHKPGNVIINFGAPIRALTMTPDQADEFARWLLTSAIRARQKVN